MVVLLAGLHLFLDLHSGSENGAFPAGLPVALLLIPVGYAAMRYGLAGSAATALWATLLWLPDLLLPRDLGHVGDDVVDLLIVDLVAFFFGQHIEAERLVHARAERATAERLAAEVGYRHLFEANRSPILVLDGGGTVVEANPAACALLGPDVVARPIEEALGRSSPLSGATSQVLTLSDGHAYRLAKASLHYGSGAATQVILEDVTEERSEGQRAARHAALVVQAEEDQRRRLARELHDEPLQLFLHLARRLELLGTAPDVPGEVAAGLSQAREQALEEATRLRNLARDLRPPALEGLGLIAALTSLLADVEEETGVVTELTVVGEQVRLPSEVELGAFRIVQEAVRNTIRHARAHKLRVAADFSDKELMLRVEDDGGGFSTDRPESRAAGLGLTGMAERAHLFGGHLELRSHPGEGTVVTVGVPVGSAQSAPRPVTAPRQEPPGPAARRAGSPSSSGWDHGCR